MLAKAVESLEKVMEKISQGNLYSEVKYDGERVQMHYQSNPLRFEFFSRNLKPVVPSKIEDVKSFVIQSLAAAATAAKSGLDVILDSEVLLWDKTTNTPLPFGTLGVHKKKNFSTASVCLVVFDILYLNGQSLLHVPLKERREILEKVVERVPGHVEFSHLVKINSQKELDDMMNEMLTKKLEGLVLKDARGTYEPDARRWLKIKKDYLHGMADSADLVILGSYFGSGVHGGVQSVYLCGVFDSHAQKWRTVCKVGNGFNEAQLASMHAKLLPLMENIQGQKDRVPAWLDVTSQHVPDMVLKTSPSLTHGVVLEVAGAEFSHSSAHTAPDKRAGMEAISIRFPRIVKERTDKDVTTATTLTELQDLVVESEKGVSLKKK